MGISSMAHGCLDTMDPLRGPGLVSVDNTVRSVDGVINNCQNLVNNAGIYSVSG